MADSKTSRLHEINETWGNANGGDSSAFRYLETSVLRRLVARMQINHERRRASFFVGPPGIGKSTATEAFRSANAENVFLTRITKRGASGPQALQQLLLALRSRSPHSSRYVASGICELQRCIEVEIERIGGGLPRSESAESFPLLTIVFDEAQRLTNGAIDALRDYNEPHYHCRGTFPIGMIFVGNNELSLQASKQGESILDEGMQDRLLYRERLSYEDVEMADVEQFVKSKGVNDPRAIDAVVKFFFAKNGQQRSFRRIADLVDELKDEALGQPISKDMVRAVIGAC
ncbi:AAA family ATPase [Pontixanthobacter sp.]|uniref:AAA family ATPase n=1 Tax=Pontixanthobacter sp. TaxID=2792078 RepID=UPI003C7CCC14